MTRAWAVLGLVALLGSRSVSVLALGVELVAAALATLALLRATATARAQDQTAATRGSELGDMRGRAHTVERKLGGGDDC